VSMRIEASNVLGSEESTIHGVMEDISRVIPESCAQSLLDNAR